MLTIATAAYGKDWEKITLPEAQPDLYHLIVIQNPEGDWEKAWTDRDDVTVASMLGRGLSRSRNLAIHLTSTPFLLFSDSDVKHNTKEELEAANWLSKETEYSFLIGVSLNEYDLPRHPTRPIGPIVIQHNSFVAVSSIELMINVEHIKKANIAFSPIFGLGSDGYPLGEEPIFLSDIVAEGMKGIHKTYYLTKHEGESTGQKKTTLAMLQGQNLTRVARYGIPNAIKNRIRLLFKDARHLTLKDKITLFFTPLSRGQKPNLHDEIKSYNWEVKTQ